MFILRTSSACLCVRSDRSECVSAVLVQSCKHFHVLTSVEEFHGSLEGQSLLLMKSFQTSFI